MGGDDNRSGWSRREFLRAGIATTAVSALGCAPPITASIPRVPELRTDLCSLLDIRYPIIQAGMAPVAGPELAAAVSNAGGLGVLAAAHLPPDEVRARIRRVRELTDKPFGVNLLLHSEVWPPADAARFPDSVVERVQTTLDRFRERLGIPRSSARPSTRPDHVPGVIEVMHEERVPVFSIGLGNPPRELVERFHARGAKVIAMVCTVPDAKAVAASGVDAIIAQGSEAGGHRSTWTKAPTAQHAAIGSMVLVPQIVDAVAVPVIAAGGITNGKGVAAALTLGASGVLVGTRFVATREARAAEFYKQELTKRDSDSTVITDAYSGLWARLIRNRYIDEYTHSGAPVLTGYLQGSAAADITRVALDRRDVDHYPLWAGQGIGMIREVRGASEVVEALVGETTAALMAAASILEPRVR